MTPGLPVLVGTDLSDASHAAILQGVDWAKRYSAQLMVAHVASNLEGINQSELVGAIRRVLEPLGAEQAHVLLAEGSPRAGLLQLASDHDVGLLVVGAGGRSTLRRALFGSTAGSVARYADCSVLVARPSPEHGPVLVGTDFSDAVTPALEVAGQEALARSAELVLLHSNYEANSPLNLLGPIVMSPPQPTRVDIEERHAAAMATLRSLLAQHPAAGDAVVVSDEPGVALVEQAEARGAGLVVVGTHGRTGFARIALGSVAEAVAAHAGCSVLIARPKA